MNQEKGIAPIHSDDLVPTTWEQVRGNSQLVARRLALMISNGRKLGPEEINALGAFALTNDVNPFAGECYYIPNVGPVLGIKGLRRKAKEALEAEAARAGAQNAASYWFDYRAATSADVDLQDGDIGVVATLHTSVDKELWLNSYLRVLTTLHNVGNEDALDEAGRLVGAEPTWQGIGVVRRAERFGPEGRPEPYVREERASKRAEAAALRRRFSALGALEVYVDSEPQISVSAVERPALTPVEPRQEPTGDAGEQQQIEGKSEPSATQNAGDIRAYLAEAAESCEPPTRRQIQQVAALLTFILGGDSERHGFLSWLAGHDVGGSADMPDQRVLTALYDWLEPQYDDGRHLYYTENKAAETAIRDAYRASEQASKQASERINGQQDLFGEG